MKINMYLISFASLIITIFGGISAIRYVRMDKLLLYQPLLALVGIGILIGSIVWRIKHIYTENK